MNDAVGKVAYLVSLAVVIGMSVAVHRRADRVQEADTESWRLVSFSAETGAPQDCRNVLGPNPQGRAVLTADGRRLVATVAASSRGSAAGANVSVTELVFVRER